MKPGDRVRVRDAGLDEHGNALDVLSGRAGVVRRVLTLASGNVEVSFDLDGETPISDGGWGQWRSANELEPA